MGKKELMIISFVIMALALPLIFLIMLLITGSAKLVLEGDVAHTIEVQNQARIERESLTRDSLMLESSLAFIANTEERKRLAAEQETLEQEKARLEILKAELARRQAEIDAIRVALEESLKNDKVATDNRIKKLAKVYEAMEPQEAARLMETLTDSLCTDIFNAMSEVQIKAEILSQISQSKASRLSVKMGKKEKQ